MKRATAAAEQEVLRIRAFANSYRDEFVWRFHEGATSGYDSRYDAVKMYGLAEATMENSLKKSLLIFLINHSIHTMLSHTSTVC